MEYKINEIVFEKEDLSSYLDYLINKTYAILGIYEDCEKDKGFDNFYVYLDRIICEIRGFSTLISSKDFISISSILVGMKDHELNHKNVKSIVFHCIGIIKRYKDI